MYHLDLYVQASDAVALDELSREFPRVPMRIITDIWTAMRRVCPTTAQAMSSARARIWDACAI